MKKKTNISEADFIRLVESQTIHTLAEIAPGEGFVTGVMSRIESVEAHETIQLSPVSRFLSAASVIGISLILGLTLGMQVKSRGYDMRPKVEANTIEQFKSSHFLSVELDKDLYMTTK